MFHPQPFRCGLCHLLFTLLLVMVLPLVVSCGPGESGENGEETASASDSEAQAGEAEKEQEASAGEPQAKLEGPPIEGFEQLMARGGIPALFDPKFIAANQADIPDEAWVLGFEHNRQAYAYDLNILNHHEVVNHHIDDLPVAAVW